MVNRKASSQPKPPAALLKLTSSKVKHVASELGFSVLFYTHAHTRRGRETGERERREVGGRGRLGSGAQNQISLKLKGAEWGIIV